MKSLRVYLFSFSILIIIYLVAQFNRPKAVDWSVTYNSEEKTPFGTYIIYHRINDLFPTAKVETFREPIYNVLTDHGIDHGTYVIINSSVKPNEYDYSKLISFINKGNDVFISSSDFGDEFNKALKIETSVEIKDLNKSAILKFTNKYLDTNKNYKIGKNITNNFFESFDTTKAVVLGTNTIGHSTFLKFPFKGGNLYLNSNPLVFTNYSLLNESGSEYAAKVLSHLKKDKTLIWDQYYALGREGDESSMRVFLRNSTLRWTFYISFFALVLFVLYEIKRRQRIIPVIEPLENATLSFVNVVGQVYYEQHDNKNICTKKILYFLEHLRVEYFLKTNTLDEEFVNNLSQKTGTPREFAVELINCINKISQLQIVANNELITLNKLIEQFYKKSR